MNKTIPVKEPVMAAQPLLVETTDAVVTLTLNRPEALNAFDEALKVALRDQVEALAADPGCRAVVLAGAGRAFCVGQDLKEHAKARAEKPADALDTVSAHFNPLVRALATLNKPVVAAVRGMAAGAGASLALLADFRIGGPKTGFLMAFANVGLAGDTGVSFTLPRIVGHAKAIELLMLAEPVSATRAYELGLLTTMVDDDDAVLPAAQELAARLAKGPTIAYGYIKRQLIEGLSGSLEHALTTEAQVQRLCGVTADHRNAVAAFLAKQAPTFTGS